LIPSSTGACGAWCQNYASDRWGGSAEFDSLAGAPPIWLFIYEVTEVVTTLVGLEGGKALRIRQTAVWYENSYGAYLGRKESGGSRDSSLNSNGQTNSSRFVIRNKDKFFEEVEAGNIGYSDRNGVFQCALLPLDWENSQDTAIDKLYRLSLRRLTFNWVEGEAVTYGMDIPRGTVLASGWVDGRYLSKPSGNHVVVFDRWGTENGKQGIWVAEQVRGMARLSFKPFGEGDYVTNASMFRVVQLRILRNPRGIYLSNE
jgi:hypothetical protein